MTTDGLNRADRDQEAAWRARFDAERRFDDPAPSQFALVGRLITGLVILLTLAGGLYIGAEWEPRILPIRTVVVEGELRGLTRESLQHTIAEHIDGGILTQNLRALLHEVEDIPWIRSATVRRVWPDQIVFSILEHEPYARWGEAGLVTDDGLVFRPRDGRLPAGMVRLDGPDSQAPELVARLKQWQQRLSGIGLMVDGIVRDQRGHWSIRVIGGTDVLLGTSDIDMRFERLLAAYPQVEAIGIPTRLDLRYSNGFAVRWLPATGTRGDRYAANY